MNMIKKLSAILLVFVMVLSFAACHPKDEVALTIEDVEITSALYMCALMNADSEARTLVDEQYADADEETEIDYFKEKIDDKKYSDWVKERAIEICKEFAAYEILCEKNNLSLTEDEQKEITSTVDYYWSAYGYQALYEVNGVSKTTFANTVKTAYLTNKYFLSIYGEDGTKPVAADDITKALEENFLIANVLSVKYASIEESQVAGTTVKFGDYAKKLEKGTPFKEIYNDYYQITETEETTEETTDAPAPKDAYASVLGSEKTDYASEYFEEAKKLKVGEVKLITNDEGVAIIVRGDLFGDEYWTENLNTPALTLLKGEEFDKDMAAYIKGLKVEKNNYAVNRFKVNKIVYPTY